MGRGCEVGRRLFGLCPGQLISSTLIQEISWPLQGTVLTLLSRFYFARACVLCMLLISQPALSLSLPLLGPQLCVLLHPALRQAPRGAPHEHQVLHRAVPGIQRAQLHNLPPLRLHAGVCAPLCRCLCTLLLSITALPHHTQPLPCLRSGIAATRHISVSCLTASPLSLACNAPCMLSLPPSPSPSPSCPPAGHHRQLCCAHPGGEGCVGHH